MRLSSRVSTAVLGAALVVACALNPATGKRELMLISEDQEIAIGKQADVEAQAAYGIYPDRALESYVASLGQKLAAVSERPQLPWSFHVADDAAVNAFAVPGGFIYVTRGLLTHLDSEAELVMVMGHEVGHVTARHSASQISKAQIATLGLGITMIAVPSLQRFGSVGEAGLGLLFMKFGRDDESQSDDLGLRYATRLGYDPAHSARAMEMLDLVSQHAKQGRMPSWLSTHPDPGNRYATLLAQIAKRNLTGNKVERESYLRRLQGMTYGEDPREGFFRGSAFYHPALGFEIQLPKGYQTQNTKQAVLAASPQGDAVVQLTLARGSSAEQASRAFVTEAKLPSSSFSRATMNGLTAVSGNFQAVSGETQVAGVAAFVEHKGRVFQLVGYTSANAWGQYGRTLSSAVSSFGPLRDRSLLDAKPRRLELVTLDREMTVAEFDRRYPSTVSESTVALVNHLQAGERLKAGRLVKRIVGGQGLEPEG